MNNLKDTVGRLSLFSVLFSTIMASCNRDFDQRLQFQTNADTAVHQFQNANKVLYVMVDGGVGAVLETEAQKDDKNPNLYALTREALYSGGSVADSNSFLPTGYADMLTGVLVNKHQVKASGNNNLAAYPTFMKVIKSNNAGLRTAAYVRNSFLYNNLLAGADQKQLLNSDAEVQTAAVAELKNAASDLVLAQYQGLYDAGSQYGYGPRSAQYVAAIKPFDNFMGALLTAIHSRPGYKSENWLIIVASNQGGLYALYPEEYDGTAFSQPKRNAFVLFANDHFSVRYFPKPNIKNYQQDGYVIGSSDLNNQLGTQAAMGTIKGGNAGTYNFGTVGGYTVQFKANFSSLGSNSPSLLAKSSGAAGNNPSGGWAIQLGSGKARAMLAGVFVGGGGNTEALNVWNTYTLRIYDSVSKRWANFYKNGQLYTAPADITGKNISTPDSMTIGGGPSYGQYTPKFSIADIRIYNVALPDAFIRANYCSTLVNPTDLYFNNLIGYWQGLGLKSTERMLNIFTDLSASKKDIIFPNGLSWTAASLMQSDNICPTVPYDIDTSLPQPVDIPLFIYSWLGVSDIAGLNLDAKPWLPLFSNAK
ncbi:LamG-like jellyroll fold domain-containing protein [Niabella sp.]|uniref:LamG-like jellyroll fold domain-containing protein n=1 Tax=Niabella sp. TaxID=1962976 RepID=UPI00262F47C1|nr:LamG-like jellyroll fold domain-containing protein [Niabella sp.]